MDVKFAPKNNPSCIDYSYTKLVKIQSLFFLRFSHFHVLLLLEMEAILHD